MRHLDSFVKMDNPASVALGVFDGLHLGHCAVIKAMKNHDKPLIPIVFALTGVPKLGKKILTNDMRLTAFENSGAAILFDINFEEIKNFSPERFVKEILNDILNAERVSCGYNYRFGKGASADAYDLKKLCSLYNIDTIITESICVDEIPVSSTKIRQLLENGDMTGASKLLGRFFGYNFEVVGGQQRGRLMGTPTINQHFPADFCIPGFGVYASVVKYNGKILPSVTNIGIRPTVGSDFPLSETWIPEFSADLYGEKIEVLLLSFIRKEEKFASMDELRRAIKNDAKTAKKIAKEAFLT